MDDGDSQKRPRLSTSTSQTDNISTEPSDEETSRKRQARRMLLNKRNMDVKDHYIEQWLLRHVVPRTESPSFLYVGNKENSQWSQISQRCILTSEQSVAANDHQRVRLSRSSLTSKSRIFDSRIRNCDPEIKKEIPQSGTYLQLRKDSTEEKNDTEQFRSISQSTKPTTTNAYQHGTDRCGQSASRGTAPAVMAKSRHLLKWRDMPPHLQFNPYIHTGYRPMLTFWQSLHSLTYLHNETINIITHGIPIVYILVVMPRSIPWERIESHFLAWCHFAGSISPWIGSFFYHLFMNWNLSSKFYYRLLQLDMLGIWVTQSFGALPMVSASIHCLHPILQWFSMACYTAFSIFGLYKAMTASSPWNRRLCFTLPFLMRNLLCLLRLTRWGGGDPTAMSTVILQDLVSVIGGAIGAMNIPERWFPGCLDYYLNSHNIMHILVVLAVYFMHMSTMKDLVWMAHGSCPGEPPKAEMPNL